MDRIGAERVDGAVFLGPSRSERIGFRSLEAQVFDGILIFRTQL